MGAEVLEWKLHGIIILLTTCKSVAPCGCHNTISAHAVLTHSIPHLICTVSGYAYNTSCVLQKIIVYARTLGLKEYWGQNGRVECAYITTSVWQPAGAARAMPRN